MDSRRLLIFMAERLYEDIKFVTEQNPTQIVDEDGVRAYNALLARVRRQFQGIDVVNDFTDWSPRSIKYKDALVVSGQMYAMVRGLADAPVRPAARSSRPSGVQHTPSPQQPQAQGQPQPRPQQQAPASRSSDVQQRPSQEAANRPPTSSGEMKPKNLHDPELYGASSPPKRNEDGTIPFSLE